MGFLTCVFESFERKEFKALPVLETAPIAGLFTDQRNIVADAYKAQRVQKGLEKNIGKNVAFDFFKVFLSENENAWAASFRITHQIFSGQPDILQNFGDSDVLYFAQTLKKVNRERHRMKAFIRFSKAADGLFFATIEPDFNVLPLVADFFKNRYADQRWLIYDVKRKYGLIYNTIVVSEVQISPAEKNALTQNSEIKLDEKNEQFQQLWKQYFKSTNIEARRNVKLHLQHVPKRYWKYLVEKQ